MDRYFYWLMLLHAGHFPCSLCRLMIFFSRILSGTLKVSNSLAPCQVRSNGYQDMNPTCSWGCHLNDKSHHYTSKCLFIHWLFFYLIHPEIYWNINISVKCTCADPEERGDRESGPHLKNHKKCRVSKQYWFQSSENHKATKPAFKIEPSSECQRNAI